MKNGKWKIPSFSPFFKDQLQRTHNASLEILERTGVEFHSERARDILRGEGAIIRDPPLVKFPPDVVERAIRNAGNRLVISNRKGKRKMFLSSSEDRTYYGPGSDTPYTLDPYSGSRRKAEREDIARAGLICDCLDNIDFAMSFGLASDRPKENSDCYHFEALVRNTVKPLVITSWDREGVKYIHEMCKAVAGGASSFRQNPFLLHYIQPTSPLKHPKDSIEKLLYSVEKGIPLMYVPVPLSGGSAPIHLAGGLALANAEFLSMLVLVQAIEKGTPLVYGASPAAMDMKTAITPYGAPETFLARCARVSMGHFYELPAFGTAGATDSKTLDLQTGLEMGSSLMVQTLCGSDIIHDIGYLDSGNTSSLPLLVVGNEMVGLVRRFTEGASFTDDEFSVDLIDEIGPGGNFLASKNTAENFKEISWDPELMDRRTFESWNKEGNKSLIDKAHQKTRKILENYESPKLASDVSSRLEEILNEGDRNRS